MSRRVTVRTEDVQCMLSSTEAAQGRGHVAAVCGVLRFRACLRSMPKSQSVEQSAAIDSTSCESQTAVPHDGMQLIYDKSHWVTSASVAGEVYVANSVY